MIQSLNFLPYILGQLDFLHLICEFKEEERLRIPRSVALQLSQMTSTTAGYAFSKTFDVLIKPEPIFQ